MANKKCYLELEIERLDLFINLMEANNLENELWRIA